MTTVQRTEPAILPDEITRQIVLPEGHADTTALYTAYKWVRNNMPVGKAIVEGYDPIWLVSKHEDVQEVQSVSEVFCAAGGPEHPGTHNPILNNQAGDAFTKQMLGGTLKVLDNVTYTDPPLHTAIKKMCFDWFKPRSVRRYTDQIRDHTRESIEQLKKLSERGQIDLVDDLRCASRCTH
jgi:cytochrome P450